MVPSGWKCLGQIRIRRCDLVGEGVSLRVGLEVLEASAIPSLPLSASTCGSDVSSELLLQHHAYLPAVMFPALMETDEPPEAVSEPQLNAFISCPHHSVSSQ